MAEGREARERSGTGGSDMDTLGSPSTGVTDVLMEGGDNGENKPADFKSIVEEFLDNDGTLPFEEYTAFWDEVYTQEKATQFAALLLQRLMSILPTVEDINDSSTTDAVMKRKSGKKPLTSLWSLPRSALKLGSKGKSKSKTGDKTSDPLSSSEPVRISGEISSSSVPDPSSLLSSSASGDGFLSSTVPSSNSFPERVNEQSIGPAPSEGESESNISESIPGTAEESNLFEIENQRDMNVTAQVLLNTLFFLTLHFNIDENDGPFKAMMKKFKAHRKNSPRSYAKLSFVDEVMLALNWSQYEVPDLMHMLVRAACFIPTNRDISGFGLKYIPREATADLNRSFATAFLKHHVSAGDRLAKTILDVISERLSSAHDDLNKCQLAEEPYVLHYIDNLLDLLAECLVMYTAIDDDHLASLTSTVEALCVLPVPHSTMAQRILGMITREIDAPGALVRERFNNEIVGLGNSETSKRATSVTIFANPLRRRGLMFIQIMKKFSQDPRKAARAANPELQYVPLMIHSLQTTYEGELGGIELDLLQALEPLDLKKMYMDVMETYTASEEVADRDLRNQMTVSSLMKIKHQMMEKAGFAKVDNMSGQSVANRGATRRSTIMSEHMVGESRGQGMSLDALRRQSFRHLMRNPSDAGSARGSTDANAVPMPDSPKPLDSGTAPKMRRESVRVPPLQSGKVSSQGRSSLFSNISDMVAPKGFFRKLKSDSLAPIRQVSTLSSKVPILQLDVLDKPIEEGLLLNIIKEAHSLGDSRDRRLLKLCIAGGDGAVNKMLQSYVELYKKNGELLDEVDMRFYLLPMGNQNHLASYLAKFDNAYATKVYHPQRHPLPMVPHISKYKSIKKKAWDAADGNRNSESLEWNPIEFYIENICHYFREASQTQNIAVFKCEIWKRAGGASDTTLYFCAWAEIGVNADARKYQNTNRLPSGMSLLEVRKLENFTRAHTTTEYNVTYVETEADGRRKPAETETRSLQALMAVNVPGLLDAKDSSPDPQSTELEMYMCDVENAAQKRKTRRSIHPTEFNHVSRRRIASVEVECVEKNRSMNILLDGEMESGVVKCRFSVCEIVVNREDGFIPKTMYFPVQSYLPVSR